MSKRNNELAMEVIHGRKEKSKVEFKAVFKKVLISSMVLMTVMGTSVPAFAATSTPTNPLNIEVEQGMSVDMAISNVRNTVKFIEEYRGNGFITDQKLEELAIQLYQLESAVKGSPEKITEVKSLLDTAEKVVVNFESESGVKAQVAIASVRASLGLDSYTATSRQAAITFTDVKEDQWFYKTVMGCAEKGLVSGIGNNQFAPFKTMSRAEFITIITRYLYPNEIKAEQSKIPAGASWYQVYYNVAISQKLVKQSEFSLNGLSTPMSRQEMALVLVRAMNVLGEEVTNPVSSSKVADYNTIGTYYKSYVLQAYTAGLLSGVDSKGTFNPNGTLTRAEAATVAYRLTEPDSRKPIVQEPDWTGMTGQNSNEDNRTEVTSNHQEFKEGSNHSEPKVGDIVVKADGTKVVLEATKIGNLTILGYGTDGPQGVDPYTGTGNYFKVGYSSWFDDSPFVKDSLTGSVFSNNEWVALRASLYPQRVGTKDGEIQNTWYKWDADMGEWFWIGPRVV